MRKFAEVQANDGTVVQFELASADTYRGQGRPKDATVELQQLSEIAEAASTVSETLRQRLAPDTLKLEVAVGLSAEVGWFFAKSTADGNLKLTLEWKKARGSQENPAD